MRTDVYGSEGAPQYLELMPEESAAAVWKLIRRRVLKQRKFLDPYYDTATLAADIGTNTRYISAALRLHHGAGYAHFVNELRVRHAQKLLDRSDYAAFTVEEIGLMSGYMQRQTFHKAFCRIVGMPPGRYRERNKEE